MHGGRELPRHQGSPQVANGSGDSSVRILLTPAAALRLVKASLACSGFLRLFEGSATLIVGLLLAAKLELEHDIPWLTVAIPYIVFCVVAACVPVVLATTAPSLLARVLPGRGCGLVLVTMLLMVGILVSTLLPLLLFTAWMDGEGDTDVLDWTWGLWLAAALCAVDGIVTIAKAWPSDAVYDPPVTARVAGAATSVLVSLGLFVFTDQLQRSLRCRGEACDNNPSAWDIFLPLTVALIASGVFGLVRACFLQPIPEGVGRNCLVRSAWAHWAVARLGGIAITICLPQYLDDPNDYFASRPGLGFVVAGIVSFACGVYLLLAAWAMRQDGTVKDFE